MDPEVQALRAEVADLRAALADALDVLERALDPENGYVYALSRTTRQRLADIRDRVAFDNDEAAA